MRLSRVQIVRSQCAIQKSLGARNSLANKCGAIVFELAIYYPASALVAVSLGFSCSACSTHHITAAPYCQNDDSDRWFDKPEVLSFTFAGHSSEPREPSF
jgi:hypothetical protein